MNWGSSDKENSRLTIFLKRHVNSGIANGNYSPGDAARAPDRFLNRGPTTELFATGTKVMVLL